MNSIHEVPFRVSARTARLIGRENVATAEGAISELVKNSYDADASFCIVRISPEYDHVPEKLTKKEYDLLEIWGLNPGNHYDLNGNFATLMPCLADAHSPEAKLIQNLVTVTVTDDGSGMDDEAIRGLDGHRYRQQRAGRSIQKGADTHRCERHWQICAR